MSHCEHCCHWDEPEIRSFEEISLDPPKKPLVSRDGKGNIDINFLRQGKLVRFYWIREDQVNSPVKLIGWIRHLSKKTQVIVPRHIAELIDIAGDIMAGK